MEQDAEDLARRHTLAELEKMLVESVVNSYSLVATAVIALIFCGFGCAAACMGVPWLGILFLIVGSLNLLPALFADFGPSTDMVRAAIEFKKNRLTPKRR